jgi:XRE family transcriptional regulator, regulator of sulfur utilization
MDALPENLKRLRKHAGLTQAELAEAAGLPRATVANLEQPGANPGVQTAISVAKALGVSLDELLAPPPEHRHYKVPAREQQEYRAEGGQYVARLVSPISSKGVQIHLVTMQPGCRSVGRPHPLGAQEFYYTLTGTSVLHIEDDHVEVEAGSMVQFPGHRRHIYANPSKEVTTAMSVVVFRMG